MTTSPRASLRATRELLSTYGLVTKHHLGQNFLIDAHVIERICALAQLESTDAVLEVGPGIGTLTLALLEEAREVLSIEADSALEPVLADLAAEHSSFHYLMKDALKVKYVEVVHALGTEPTMFVANLPYNIAAPIVLDVMQNYHQLRAAVMMVQREVADRIAAVPGTKAYGAYSAKLALVAKVVGRFEVARSCFMPPPHVDSSVVRLERYGADEQNAFLCMNEAERAEVEGVIEAAFATRRKTIRNSMRAFGFEKELLDAAFETCGISAGTRGETLEPQTFVALARALRELQGGERVDE